MKYLLLGFGFFSFIINTDLLIIFNKCMIYSIINNREVENLCNRENMGVEQ